MACRASASRRRRDVGLVGGGEVAAACDGLSRGPRERLGCLTPYEALRSEALHLL